jgi:hypothetical protein
MWLFNTGDCLIEVNAWAGLTVCDVLYKDSSLYADLAKKHDHHGLCLFLSCTRNVCKGPNKHLIDWALKLLCGLTHNLVWVILGLSLIKCDSVILDWMEMNDFSQNLDLINDRHDQSQAVHEWSLNGGHSQRWKSKNLSLIMEERHVYLSKPTSLISY